MRPQYIGTGGSMANACNGCAICGVCAACGSCILCAACGPGILLNAVIVAGAAVVDVLIGVIGFALLFDRDGGESDG